MLKESAQTKIFIGSVLANPRNASIGDFSGEVWTEISEVENIPVFGGEFGTGTFSPLSAERVHKFKTIKDSGNIEVPMALDSGDAGQAALIAAADSRSNYKFKVELNDAGSTGGSPESPTTFYFAGLVTSNQKNINGVEDITRRVANIAINTDVYEVAAV